MDKEFLEKCRLFEGLKVEEINRLTEDLQITTVPKGKSVIAEKTLGDNLYLIVSGSVEINKELGPGEDMAIAQLKVMSKGDFFGEMAIIDDEPRSATVIAKENSELMIIPKKRFFTIAYSNPKVLFNLISALSWRLRDSNTKFAELMEKLIAQNRLMAVGLAASKIIHDIKTPLSIIVLTAELIQRRYPESAEFSDSIVRQTLLIDQYVREILDYAGGKPTPTHVQKVNLDAFLDDIKEYFIQTLVGRDIAFSINNSVSREVMFDESKMRRVILNLIKNSSEAMTIDGYIRIEALMEGKELEINIIDNGPGIPDHIKANLYSPFQSEGKTLGTGLGLAISQKLVHENKGTLEYSPNEPHGTILTIKIPQIETK